MNNSYKFKLSTSLIALACAVSAPTAAQDASVDDGPIEEVIVTGEKRSRSLQDTQSSVSVISAEELASTYTPDFDELILRIPNVNNAFGDAGFAVRGVAQNGVTAGLNTISSNLTLTINVDDIPLATTQQNLLSPTGAWDLSRVEVFRGPQSTIQGRNSLAGAILLYSKDPTEEFTGDAQAVYGEFGTRQYSAAVGGALIPDVLSFRASYDHQESDGFTFNSTLDSDTVAGNNDELARLKLLFKPADNFSVKLTGIYSDAKGTVFQGFELDTFQETGERVNVLDNPQRRFDESYLFGARAEWDVNENWTLTSITSYADSESGRTQDGDGTPQPIAVFTQDNTIESFTQEFRASFDNGKGISGVFGGFYADIDARTDVVGSFPGDFFGIPGTLVSIVNVNDEATENYAAFGEIEWQATEKLRFLVGLRYDNETITTLSDSQTIIDPPVITLPASGGTVEADFDAFLPKGQIVYDWTKTISTSFTYSRGYRSGGSQLSVLGTSLPFDAEFTNNYEVAFRSTFLDERLVLNANAYLIDWTDQQVAVPLLTAFPEVADQLPAGLDPNTLTATVNAGESEVYGFEVEADYKVDETLGFFLSLGLSKTEFIDFPVNTGQNFAGNVFRFAPEFSAAFGFNYQHQSGFFLNGNVSYSDGQFGDNENSAGAFAPDYTVVNARAGYQMDNYSISVFANNLLDETYLTYQAVAFNQGQGGAERVIGVQLTAGF